MKKWLAVAVLAVAVLYFPTACAVLLGALGTFALAAASKTAVWAFLCGLLAWPHIAARTRRWTR